jgi:DNA-directed RNA polymerase specialized sigma24 family protein
MQELPNAPLTQEHYMRLREVFDAIQQLPLQQRQILQGFFTGKSDDQLAAELQIDSATVRSLRRFGRIRLQALLSDRAQKRGVSDHE